MIQQCANIFKSNYVLNGEVMIVHLIAGLIKKNEPIFS